MNDCEEMTVIRDRFRDFLLSEPLDRDAELKRISELLVSDDYRVPSVFNRALSFVAVYCGEHAAKDFRAAVETWIKMASAAYPLKETGPLEPLFDPLEWLASVIEYWSGGRWGPEDWESACNEARVEYSHPSTDAVVKELLHHTRPKDSSQTPETQCVITLGRIPADNLTRPLTKNQGNADRPLPDPLQQAVHSLGGNGPNIVRLLHETGGVSFDQFKNFRDPLTRHRLTESDDAESIAAMLRRLSGKLARHGFKIYASTRGNSIRLVPRKKTDV